LRIRHPDEFKVTSDVRDLRRAQGVEIQQLVHKQPTLNLFQDLNKLLAKDHHKQIAMTKSLESDINDLL